MLSHFNFNIIRLNPTPSLDETIYGQNAHRVPMIPNLCTNIFFPHTVALPRIRYISFTHFSFDRSKYTHERDNINCSIRGSNKYFLTTFTVHIYTLEKVIKKWL